MKKLTTILALMICIYASGQKKVEIVTTSISSDKVNDIDKQLIEVQTQWRSDVDFVLRGITERINNLRNRVESQSEAITQLKIEALRDSLKIDRLEKQINYTQSFIKDSVIFISENPKPIEVNLLGDVTSYHSAWSFVNEVYSYDASVDNYDYIYFNLIENLIPNSTYIITFEIKTDSNALLNFWLYGTTTQRLSDTSYETGSYTIEVTVTDDEKDRIGIRARNNVGGDFEIINLKVVEK